MASTYINRAFTSAGNQKTWTMSGWFKRSNPSGNDYIFCYAQTVGGGSSNRGYSRFNTSGNLVIGFNPTGSTWLECTVQESGSNIVYRDPSAWYHIVFACDTTQATEANRLKIYVNGVQRTFDTYPSQNYDTGYNANGYTHEFGSYPAGRSNGYYDGSMSHLHFIDGTQYQASDFGETDSTTGEWKINTSPSVTYGTNGFFILKNGNSVTDQSGNSNNFTAAGGTLTNTEDCPSDVFATFNPLAPTGVNQTMQNGNTYLPGPNSANYWQSVPATIGVSSGKFYCEFKDENAWGSTSDSTRRYGICNLDNVVNTLSSGADVRFSDTVNGYAYMNASGVRYTGSTISGTTSTYPTFSPTDIIQIAMDLDNNKLFFGKNGTWLDSSDPAAGTNPVATIADGTWTFYAEIKYGSDNVSANFGNGYFRTTAITSEGTNASNIGKFEYDVPTGYTALSTKGLNE